jgi:hypothetical protein
MKLFLIALAALVLAAPTAFAAEGDDHAAAAGDAPKKAAKMKKPKAKANANANANADAKNPCAKTDPHAHMTNPCAAAPADAPKK